MEYSVVYITASSAEEANAIARGLVEEKLVACVNMLPGIQSLYWWQGAVECAAEVLMIAKTRSDLVPRVVERVKQLHSYKVPEIIALPIAQGNGDYLRWIGESVSAPG